MQEQQFIFTHLYHGKYVFLAAYIVPLETVEFQFTLYSENT